MFKVLCFNVRFETKESNPDDNWENRRKPMAEFLAVSGASIIGLQECLPSQLEYLAAELRASGYDYFGTGRAADGSDEACPIFYKTDDFSLVRSQTRWLSYTPEAPGSKHPWADLPRIVTMVELRCKADGSSMYAFSTHFSHLVYVDYGRIVQEQQAGILVRLIDKFCGGEPREHRAQIVIMGDFNSTRDDGAPPVLVKEGYIDASQTGEQRDDTPTWVGFQSGNIVKYMKEYQQRKLVDFIFSSPDLINTSYHVYPGQYATKCGLCPRYLSDHRALSVVVRLPDAGEDAAAAEATGLADTAASEPATAGIADQRPEPLSAAQQAPRELISL